MKSTPIRNPLRLLRLVVCTSILTLWVLGGCVPLTMSLQTPLPSLTPTPPPPTPTATATIVWFPPTATYTPFPSPTAVSPTPEMRTGIGIMLLEDDFENGRMWGMIETEGGSVRLGKNEITIAITKQRTYLSSLRVEPQLVDFYLEITATTNFCRGMDEYGLILRAASVQDFYRFGVTCDGQVRLDRIYRGQASSPQPLLLSGAVPIGAPSSVRLGVWAVGEEMRYFVNDELQFSVKEGTITAGALGVFARSASDEPLTVNFSELSIWEVSP